MKKACQAKAAQNPLAYQKRRKIKMKKRLNIFIIFILSLLFVGCGSSGAQSTPESSPGNSDSVNTIESALDDDSSENILDNTSDDDSPDNTKETIPDASSSADAVDNDNSESIAESPPAEAAESTENELAEDGSYTTKEDVARYLYLYGHLPSNFITKKDAEQLGWTGGSLEPYAPGMCIGGSRFGNYEGLLPEKEGRTYTECDIDTLGADKRGAKRIVFSNDGLIYYTEDHYETFELLYGDDSDG